MTIAPLLVVLLLLGFPSNAEETARSTAIVADPIVDVTVRPDATSAVDDQVILGETVRVLEEARGFTRVETPGRLAGWVPARSVVRLPRPEGPVVEVTSNAAHLYRTPDATESRPLLTAPLGSRLTRLGTRTVADLEWLSVALPDGRIAWVLAEDVRAAREPGASHGTPADWIALGRRFLGAPYTWGGTTPLGADCSGLVYRILERHGVTLRRNSSEQCFQDPQLVPIRLTDLTPGDLVFFGTETRIDHEAMLLGDGQVLQASVHGVPSTQVSSLAGSPRLARRLRYARRFAFRADAPKARGPEPKRLEGLKQDLDAMMKAGGATYAVAFKDLSTGAEVKLNAGRVMHAASTMKTAVMLEVLRRVDEGTLALTDEVTVTATFPSLVDGSPFTLEPEAGSDGKTAAYLGKKAPLGLLVDEMIVRSSNLATNVVLTLVGVANVQRFVDELGAKTVKVRRCVEDLKAYERGLNNETDAAGMAALMEACVRSPLLSAGARAKAWEILAGQTIREEIPLGLHPQSGALVAHKTGNTSKVQHDAGIVRLPDGRELVLVLLATDFGDEKGRERVFEVTRAMTRRVWDYMIEP